MKKLYIFLVVIFAASVSISAQNSNASKDKASEQAISNGSDFYIKNPKTPYRTDPLILVDGKEVSKGVLERLTPDKIKSFSVISDAKKALEQYGNDGVNGVIVVESKLSKKALNKLIKEAQKDEKKAVKLNSPKDK